MTISVDSVLYHVMLEETRFLLRQFGSQRPATLAGEVDTIEKVLGRLEIDRLLKSSVEERGEYLIQAIRDVIKASSMITEKADRIELVLEEAPTTSRSWQPIGTAPRDGTPVLLYLYQPLAAWGDPVGGARACERSHVVIGWYEEPWLDSEKEREWATAVAEEGLPDSGGGYSCFPIRVAATHWMPLPGPPK